MRIILVLFVLTLLCGCESLGEIIREKKYSVQINETPHSKQAFGYNDDYEYVGFMVEGTFGK